MIRTVKAVIDEQGVVRLLERVDHAGFRRALVTILDDEGEWESDEAARLSEPALSRDWNRPEEDKAWSHLQQAKSS